MQFTKWMLSAKLTVLARFVFMQNESQCNEKLKQSQHKLKINAKLTVMQNKSWPKAKWEFASLRDDYHMAQIAEGT